MTRLQIVLPLMAFLAFATTGLPRQDGETPPAPDVLVRLLESKGIITAQEGAMVSAGSSPAEVQRLLAKLLSKKGVITHQEYDQTVAALAIPSPPEGSSAQTRLIASADDTNMRVSSGSVDGPPATASRTALFTPEPGSVRA